MNRRCLALLCLLISPAAIRAQVRHKSRSSPVAHRGVAPASLRHARADHSQDPLLVEQYAITVRFDDDGTGERDLSVRMRVQNAAGAQQLRALSFNYDAATERMELRYLRVRKADGSVVDASTGSGTVADEITTAAKTAPAYSDAKECHVTLPKLAVGDTLEYQIATRIVTPPAPGQFWFEHDFLAGAPALDERLEISVPENRAVIVKSPHFPYTRRLEGGRAIFLWKRTDVRPTSAAKTAGQQSPPGEEHPPDVELTSFASWTTVARWYAGLENGRSAPDSAIRAKTADLTKGLATDLAKIQALYDYVSQSIRYISIPLGRDGFEPRSAADIFSSGYGDAKDKQILLASMLQAAGFRADAALIPYSRRLDAAMPSPAQFEHVLTVIPLAGQTIWLDSTVGVAPFRLLPAPLRGKAALLVASNGAGRIVETPADPPFRSSQEVAIDGSVSALGKLTAHARYSLLGDTELALRLAFQNTPPSQWKDLGQTVLAFDGIRGEVTSVELSNLSEFEKPFDFDIGFTESNFFDWSSKSSTAAMPLLAIGLPNPPQRRGRPVDLGSPLTVNVRLHLEMPNDFAARPPVGTSITRDFADFQSSYRFAGHVFAAQRSLAFKMRELPAQRLSDYAAFTRAVTLDQNQPLSIDYVGTGVPSIPASASADDLLAAGLASLDAGDARSAVPLFQRVVQLNPRHKEAWNDLGLAYLRLGKYSDAASAFRKQLEVSPADEHAGNYLGVALERQQDFDGAIAAFRKQAADHPLDPVAHGALGELLVNHHDYAAAIPELEKGGVLAPKNPDIQVALGRAYLNLDKIPESVAAFDHAARLSPTPPVWNDIAYQLAGRKIELDKAQKYAESAVSGAADNLHGIDLANLNAEQIAESSRIGAYWDTLGWVYFQQGDVRKAEPYIRAAWLLNFDRESGDHLAQIYEKLGDKDRAIRMCALVLAAPNALPDTRARLTLLLGGNSRIDELVAQAKPELKKLHSFLAGKFAGHQDARAEFLVLLSPGEKRPRVDSVRFLSGDEELRPLGERLRSLDLGAIFPDASPVELVRHGTLSCSAKSGVCMFKLTVPEAGGATD
jgi:tetratricopeptide (TPR) repeat protein/transglutaminase-like putative cysteine protease